MVGPLEGWIAVAGWDHDDNSWHLAHVRDRLLEQAPWIDPEVVTMDGVRLVRVHASHALTVLAKKGQGCWQVEVRDQFGEASGRGAQRRIDLALDTDVTVVADRVLKACIDYWRGTQESPTASEAMKSKAAEQLDALNALEGRPPISGSPGRTTELAF